MKKECEMTKGKKNDFERIQRLKIISLRARNQAKKGENKISKENKTGQEEGEMEEDRGSVIYKT